MYSTVREMPFQTYTLKSGIPTRRQPLLDAELKLKSLITGGPRPVVVVVFVNRPLPKNGGMAEDHGALESGKLPKSWTRGR